MDESNFTFKVKVAKMSLKNHCFYSNPSKVFLFGLVILLCQTCSWTNRIVIGNMTSEVVTVTFHLQETSAERPLFQISQSGEWKVYKSKIIKTMIKTDYDEEVSWLFAVDNRGFVTGKLGPNESLVLGNISGGSSINDEGLITNFNMDYLKLASTEDSMVIVNSYVRKAFVYNDKDYRIQLDDNR